MTVAAFHFRAMNTDIALLAPAAAPNFQRACDTVRDTFSEFEACLSRFQPDSELSGLNRSGGKPFRASPLLFEAVVLALRSARDTDGVFDPTVLDALEQSGYDRSFEFVASAIAARPSRTQMAPVANYRSIHCDMASRTITLDGRLRVDLGGVGKGMAVDRALAATAFLGDRCINAGGDVAARGVAGLDEPWTVALEDAGDAGTYSIAVRDAAIATSTTRKRRWRVGGEETHHLIDPCTGRASSSPLRTVTAIARSCVQADVAAKTALLVGDHGMTFLDTHGMHGFGVRHDGSTVCSQRWPQEKREA